MLLCWQLFFQWNAPILSVSHSPDKQMGVTWILLIPCTLVNTLFKSNKENTQCALTLMDNAVISLGHFFRSLSISWHTQPSGQCWASSSALSSSSSVAGCSTPLVISEARAAAAKLVSTTGEDPMSLGTDPLHWVKWKLFIQAPKILFVARSCFLIFEFGYLSYRTLGPISAASFVFLGQNEVSYGVIAWQKGFTVGKWGSCLKVSLNTIFI